MTAEGLCPSARSVLKKLGRGSLTTIAKHVTAWRIVQRPELSIPESLQPALAELWSTAVREAAARMQPNFYVDADGDLIRKQLADAQEQIAIYEQLMNSCVCGHKPNSNAASIKSELLIRH
ncbi:MAG TPA: DNA-binding protein [Planktothrix sp.]